MVPGRNIGSALIDHDMEQLLIAKLAGLPSRMLERGPTKTAQVMMKDTFEILKCAFGSDAANMPAIKLKVPGLSTQDNFPHLDITRGKMDIKM